ncbi:hypothetical protein HHK36_011786 [Tetracentron sinense]|uniref:TFIIS N-terminal domain-containing protein n=1 Tax=Tetracentron sinense TaxID=13715 RepID=A0A835DK67_TETSI|nr:hypothetical protein HHK36_011786 [Tetracentron sinense]
MAAKSGALDYWRKYFLSANSDIFEVIEYAIVVAASDCPKEFRMRRDRIAEKLFSCQLSNGFGCDRVDAEGDRVFKTGFDGSADFGGGVSKESKVNSSTDDHAGMKMTQVSTCSYDEVEALTEEIEEESQIIGEVLRIKGVLSNSQDESVGALFESLRKLQLMALSVEILKVTEIGKAVNGLRKHGSKEIRQLVRTLIDGWKVMVDEWVNATAAIAEGSPASVNPSVVDDEEGLPSPPMEEGVFFTTQPTSMELSKFFDGMDDDGNPRNSGELDKNREIGRKPSMENQNFVKRNQQLPHEANVVTKENKGQQKNQVAVIKQTKPSNTISGLGKPPKQSSVNKVNNETKFQQKPVNVPIQKRQLVGQQDKLKCSGEVSVQMKLEASKRKLQQGYQQAENAKKQRTIQVMELRDLPKQGLGHRNLNVRPGNNNRNWANGRR